MNTIVSDRYNTYLAERELKVQTDVEDQEVVSYVYLSPTAKLILGQPGTELMSVIRTPLIEMGIDEQHWRVVRELMEEQSTWG